MFQGKVFITDYGFASLQEENRILGEAGYEVMSGQCRTPEEVLSGAREADAILVQWAPVPASVIQQLDRCKVIVRYGIGTDNVDLAAARSKGIPVCNVPDYCLDEVADHTMAMVLLLGRQIKQIETRIAGGIWKITPPNPMAPFRESVFGLAGFGRIAREVLQRAAPFKFKMVAYDPFVSEQEMRQWNVQKLELEPFFAEADMISLHLPLNSQTRHFINRDKLHLMKETAYLVNTSRGELIDNLALAEALQTGGIAGAGLDVFETEPLAMDHPLRDCPNAVLTSHTAWFSDKSSKLLQLKAVEEVWRALNGMPLKNRVN